MIDLWGSILHILEVFGVQHLVFFFFFVRLALFKCGLLDSTCFKASVQQFILWSFLATMVFICVCLALRFNACHPDWAFLRPDGLTTLFLSGVRQKLSILLCPVQGHWQFLKYWC